SASTPPPTSHSAARRISASLRFLLMTRRMRSEPASGATVTDRLPPAPSARASPGVIRSALSDEGAARPPRAATSSHSPATPGRPAIAAPTRPIAPRSARPRAVEELAQHLLRLADQEEVDELGDRLGVEKGGRAAGEDERRVHAALPAPERDAGQRQAVEHVHVVRLERKGERDHVEVAERAVLL